MNRKYHVFFAFGLTLLLLALINLGCKTGALPDEYDPQYQPPLLNAPVVVYHDVAAEAGHRIINAGGNAFDAFVAVVLVENVVSPGYVTTAGLLSTLVFEAASNQVMYLDAGFNSVADPDGAYDAANPVIGKTAAVPGLLRGLEAISNRYGRLSWSELIQPAVEIARDGFTIDQTWAYRLQQVKTILQRSEYGRRTFYPGGNALQEGDILRQPELAQFLQNVANHGADYMYTGEWAQQCVQLVRQEGGLMTMEDMAAYQPTWTEPWRMSYRGHDLCAASGRSMYALTVLLGLKTLEHTTIQPLGHFSTSADALEIMVRVSRAVEEEYWTNDYRYLDNRPLVESRLTLDYTKRLWDKVKSGQNQTNYQLTPAPHTLTLVVADTEGNVVSGKHSINSNYFGVGLFVQGIPLSGTCEQTYRYTKPGERRTQEHPMYFRF